MITALRQRMLQALQLSGLSEHTQEAYLRAVRQLANHLHTPPDRLCEQQVREYFLHLKNDRKFASASLGSKGPTIVMLYLLPRVNAKLLPQLRKLPPGTRVISLAHQMADVKPDEHIVVDTERGGVSKSLKSVSLWLPIAFQCHPRFCWSREVLLWTRTSPASAARTTTVPIMASAASAT
jgi:Phage integrase, N-terminal SAM-like domain